jgi:SAM-dependent methyltransferase
MQNQKRLFDPMLHPEWVPPHSEKWYAQLGAEGEYKYPWKSQFDEPTAVMVFAQRLSSYIEEDSRVLDVGCGHGEFTYQWASEVKEVVGIDVIEGFILTANRNKPSDTIRFLSVNTDEKLPFSDDYFDVVYTKKGPWLYQEANGITKRGGIVMGLYHGGTDGGLRELFPDLYHPMPINPKIVRQRA